MESIIEPPDLYPGKDLGQHLQELNAFLRCCRIIAGPGVKVEQTAFGTIVSAVDAADDTALNFDGGN